MKKNSHTSQQITIWKNSIHYNIDYNWFVETLRNLSIAISVDGDFVDQDTRTKLHINHLKCMLRYEYLASGDRFLSGKALDIVLEKFLVVIIKVTRRMDREHHVSVVDFEYEDKFI